MEANKNYTKSILDIFLSIISLLESKNSAIVGFSLVTKGKTLIFSPDKAFLPQLLDRMNNFLTDCYKNNLSVTFECNVDDTTFVLIENIPVSDIQTVNNILAIIKFSVLVSIPEQEISTKAFLNELCSCFEPIFQEKDIKLELINLDTKITFNKIETTKTIISSIYEAIRLDLKRIRIFSYIEKDKFILEIQYADTKNHFSFEINQSREMVSDKISI